jgi:hypothetical protein
VVLAERGDQAFARSEHQAMVTYLSSGIVDPEELEILARVLEKARETLAVEKGSPEHEALAIALVQLTHRLSEEDALLAELIRSRRETAA